MSIKEAIKNQLLDLIAIEQQRLEYRIIISDRPNFDQTCEQKFLDDLSKFANNI